MLQLYKYIRIFESKNSKFDKNDIIQRLIFELLIKSYLVYNYTYLMGKKSKQAKTAKPVEQQILMEVQPKGQKSQVQETTNDLIKHQKKHKQEKHQPNIKVDNIYNWAEIEKHNQKDNIWVVVEQGVYDVTKLVDHHPGGEKVILDCAGKNATTSFENGQHPQRVINKVLPKMRIGKIDKTSVPESPEGYVKNGKIDAVAAIILTIAILIFMGYLALKA